MATIVFLRNFGFVDVRVFIEHVLSSAGNRGIVIQFLDPNRVGEKLAE